MAVLADAAPCAPVPGRTCKRQWTVPLTAVQRGPAVVSGRPCRRRGCPQRRTPAGCQCPQAASAVHTSGPSVSAGRADLARNPSRCPRNRTPRQCPLCVWECGQVLAGRPLSTADTAAAGGVRLAAELDTAAVSDVRCCFRNRGRVSGRLVSAADTSAACGVRCYRKRSSGPRLLDGCRHCRYAWASWRPSRSPSWART
jgi:hypothetical protein